MKLSKYRSKRDLKTSNEPKAVLKKGKSASLSFVVQEHHASHLHYDLRLEAEGVLKSWAVPKEPSMDPTIKRLAIHVEDHPYGYKDFKGKIASGYGAGTVAIWDKGAYDVDGLDAKGSEKEILSGLKKGALHFTLHGKKLKGIFHLIRLKRKNQWLLIKKNEGKVKPMTLGNVDKIYWPKEKITKGDLLQYYKTVAPFILPHLKDRPVSLKRYPDGIEGFSFFQKNIEKPPKGIKTASIQHESKTVHYLLIQDQNSLLYAANLGSIELHPFFSRVKTLKKPDFLLLDLDPKTASFEKVIQIAQAIHAFLKNKKIPSFCKTSGATGLHIAIPLGAEYSYKQAKAFAKTIAFAIHEQLPDISTLERMISKRKGKVYIDYHQNDFGKTFAAPYSVRAREGAPVSTPLKWDEVKRGLDPKKFTFAKTLERLKKLGDLFKPVLGKGVNLQTKLKAAK